VYDVDVSRIGDSELLFLVGRQFMRSSGLFLRLALCFALALGTSPASSQAPADVLKQEQAQIADLQSQLSQLQGSIADLRADNALLSQFLKNLLASVGSDQATRHFSSTDKETLKKEAQDTQSAADSASAAIKQIPPDALDPADAKLKDRILKCVNQAVDTGKAQLSAPTADAPIKIAEACSGDEQRAILDQLNKARNTAVDAWNKCRVVLAGAGLASDLPVDPSGLSVSSIKQTADQLAKLRDDLDKTVGDAKDCAQTADKAFKQIQADESTSAAISTALTFAAQVCASAGGNPYVCGGMLIVAILMSLFGNKGDGGGGDGGGGKHGTGPTNVASGLPGKSPGPAQNGPGGGQAQSTGGDFGDTADGSVACNTAGSTLMCWQKTKPQIKLKIDPEHSVQAGSLNSRSELAASISGKKSSKLYFCTADKANFLSGIILTTAVDANKYYPIAAYYDATGLSMNYPPQSLDKLPGEQPDKICQAIAK
jgi:hypothetical protein